MASTDSTNQRKHATSTSSHSSSNILESESKQAPRQTAAPCLDEEAVSKADGRSFIGRADKLENASHASPPQDSLSQDVAYGSWQNAPNSKCYASFGDEGTTATVGAFGQLIQFSGHFEAGSSGMFCADHATVPEPYYVEARAKKLYSLSQQPFHCGPRTPSGLSFLAGTRTYESIFGDRFPLGNPRYGLRFPGLVMMPDTQPTFKWIHWKWPCYTYSPGQFKSHPELQLTIQWMIHKGIVLQRCIFENYGEGDLVVNLDFGKSMAIRDLDHLDPQHNFNQEGHHDHDTGPGSGGYNWVCVHKFNTEDIIRSPETNHPSRGMPNEVKSRHSRTDGYDHSQKHKDAATSSAPPPLEATRNDTTASSTGLEPSQGRGSRAQEPVQDSRSPTHEPASTADSKTERAGKSEPNTHDHDVSFKDSYGISVISSVAVDGKLQQFKDTPNPQKWKVVVRGQRVPRPWVALEVTAAYKMEHLKASNADWKTHNIQWQDMRVSEFLRSQQQSQSLRMCITTPFMDSTLRMGQTGENIRSGDGITSPVGTPGKTIPPSNPGQPQNCLEFVARRQLEHILSVCAVQVTPYTHDIAISGAPQALKDVTPVALTCGDMSGHRICWSGSFFEFRFLVECYKTLGKNPEGQGALLYRIRQTCLGHLEWLRSIHKRNTGQHFRANYWVTGKPMVKPKLNESWIAEEGFLDTAFQILKAAAFVELWEESKESSKKKATQCAAELMSDWAPSWLYSMGNSDQRKKYAWPHSEKEGVNAYRLDQHVWIWRALKSLEMNNYQAWVSMFEKAPKYQHAVPADDQNVPSGSPTIDSKKIRRLREVFSSEVVQREVARRFTTENTVLRQVMLATTRSIRESRFMLHARDTALLYKDLFDFLGEHSLAKELWKTTIRSQMYHTQYRETTWGKTLRYAQYIMLGAQDLRIDNRPPNELIRTATDTLIRSCSPNGLFPGRVEISTNKPVDVSCIAEEDMDSYYHASFEIPYILLSHAGQVSDAYKQPRLDASKFRRNSDPIPGGDFLLKGSILHHISPVQADAERKALSHASYSLPSRPAISELDNREVFQDGRLTMEKAVPIDALVDSSNIVKLDDEWLYKYPDFLSRDEPLEIGDTDEDLAELKSNLKSLDASRAPSALDKNTTPTFGSCIVDVPSSKRINSKRKEHRPTYHQGEVDEMVSILEKTRTARSSKKRLLSFVMAPRDLAPKCYATTEASERPNLEDFFERHFHYKKYPFDNCSMIQNYWESEFHLSYYQLLRKPSTLRQGFAPHDGDLFPGSLEMQIFRASASFRFYGDFFDRHWTCYMLDSTPKGPITDPNLLRQRTYCQRKVLEQRYFADILKSLTESAEEILDEVNHCLGVTSGSFSTSIDTTNAYLSWRAVWQEFQPLLQKMHADLASTQTTVCQWEAREEDRGKEKPRWTSNDERKYRASITTIRREIKHQTGQLQYLHETTKSLQDLCSNRLDKAREDLQFRSEQNIATFTYVTVVFLPIGFTASIFSMNGSPEASLAVEVVIASAIALAVTIVALMNAKGVAGALEKFAATYKDLTAKAKQSSVMIRNRQTAETKAVESKAGDTKAPRRSISSTDAMSWNLVFWAGYILMELPSRSITDACRILGWPRHVNKDLEGLKESKSILAEGAVASGLLYCLLPGMALLEKEAAVVFGRSSMKFRLKSATQMVSDLLLAFFAVPVFLLTWIFQILCFNAWDAVALLGECLRQGMSYVSLPESDNPSSSILTHLTKPPRYFRPMKMWKNHLRPEKKTQKSQTSNKPGDTSETVPSPEKRSQAPQ